MKLWRMMRDAAPILWRMMRTDDVDRFMRESEEFRARYGIGER